MPAAVLPENTLLQIHSPTQLSLKNAVDLLGPLDDGWRLRDVPSEDLSLNEPRNHHLQLMADETLCWNREHLCIRALAIGHVTNWSTTYGRFLPGSAAWSL